MVISNKKVDDDGSTFRPQGMITDGLADTKNFDFSEIWKCGQKSTYA